MTPTRQGSATLLGNAITATALLAIGVATLIPQRAGEFQPATVCIVCGGRGLADAILNVILFAPLGLGLALSGVRVRRALLVAALASALVECAQIFIPGRDPSIGDVLFNTVGGWAGFGFVLLVRALVQLDDRRSGRLSVAAGFAVAIAVLLTGWLLQPSFPRKTYWGQWTPNFGHLEWYRGRIQSATIAGREVRPHRIEDSQWVREALLAGGPVAARFTAGPPVPALAPLFSMNDENEREVFLVGPDRNDLVFRYRTRSTALHLDQPDLRVPHGWPDLTVGLPYQVRVWSPTPGEWCTDGPATRRCGLGFTVGSAWGILFYAEHFPPRLRQLLSLGWVGALLVPVGFFIRRRWQGGFALVIALVALATLPGLVHLRPTPVSEWGGAVLGLAAGALAWRVATAARTR